jgi:uncharacterized membrane protein
MNATYLPIIAFFTIILIDLPWLLYQGMASAPMWQRIQGGRPAEMRILAAIPVYIALTYLLLKQESLKDAVLAGAAVYAVYDFTNLAVFKDYTFTFAVQDTLWGGTLFGIAYLLLKRVKKTIGA